MGKIKRFTALFLALIISVTTLSSLTPSVLAFDLSQAYEVSWDYTLTDENGDVFDFYVGLRKEDNPYGYANSAIRRTMHDYTVKRKGLSGDKDNWVYNRDYAYAFCIEWGIPIRDDKEYIGSSDPSHGNKWAAMSPSQQRLLMLALSYGYPNRTDLEDSKDANACYSATQLIVWQISTGFRTSATSLNDKTYPMAGYSGTMTEQLTRNQHLKRYYDRILEDMRRHDIMPDFTGSSLNPPTYELTPSGGVYKATFTDRNGVLEDFYVSSSAGLHTQISGNTLTVTSNSPITSDKTVELTRRMPSTNHTTGFLIWSVPGKESSNQDMVTGVDNDPQKRYIKFKASTGNLSIIKTTQHNNGSVAGFKFEVRDSSNKLVGQYTSLESGVIHIPDLQAGRYSVKEVDLSSDFVEPSPNPVSVEVKPGQTASVSFDNIKKRGIITVQKTNANPSMGDYSLEGAEFEVRDAGGKLVDSVICGPDGRGTSKILPLGVYKVKESKSPYGFTLDKNTYTVTLSGTQGEASIVYSPEVSVAEQPQVGKINIHKYNENPDMGDYDLSGAVFEILDRDGAVVDTVTVDSEGKGQSKELPLDTYRVREKSAPYGFYLNQNSYEVTLSYAGQEETVTYETVDVPQRPQTGRIKIYKENAEPSMGDYSLEGAVFEIRDKTTGDLMDTVVTDRTGFAQSKELPLKTYQIVEKTAPYGFVLNTKTYEVTLNYAGDEVSVTYSMIAIPENPQVGTISIEKLDNATGSTAQGDSTLSGAVFEIWDEGKTKVVDMLYCGDQTTATSKELPLGNYFYREKIPPLGYTHDPAYYPISITYEGQNVSVVKRYGTIENKVIQGKIALVKHTEEPDEDVDPSNPQVEQPLEGAIFEIYLKEAGSYEKAKESERDRLTTSSDGYCESKWLPYGWYTVEEVFSPQDTKLVEPFDVFISSDGEIYRYIANNPHFKSLVKIIKVDSETGKTIPAAGVTFKIWDIAEEAWVAQTIHYPTPTTITEFQTAADGTLVLPEPLKSGDYLLYEEKSCYGYLLTDEPVPFTIHSSQEDPAIAEVIMANKPAKGTIVIEKTGELLTGVQEKETEYGTQYVPVFEQTPVSRQEFEVVAASDVYTLDGTLRYEAGTVVDTVVIKNGRGESKQLYLGDYVVREKTTGEPLVLDPAEYPVSLEYEGETVPVVHSSVAIENKRQQVAIEVDKQMEELADAPENFAPYADVLFGLYANEDIENASGDIVIPKDGLIALLPVDSDGKGLYTGKLPFAQTYVKELKTNVYYQMNPEKYEINIAYQGETVQTAKIRLEQTIPNELKQGRIVIYKRGEMLVGSTQSEQNGYTVYQPVYETAMLPGVTFDILADENIYDIFGNLLYAENETVDTVVTGPDGRAVSRLLHLGKFRIVESSVPDGVVINREPQHIVLGAGGEVAEVISHTISIENQRQKASIDLSKVCEIPENAPEDFNPYKDILFGIYANENISGIDGEIAIPKDALMELVSISEDGKATLKSDFPIAKYYAKELSCMDGYQLLEEKLEFAFEYQGPDTEVVNIHIGGKDAENRLQRGSLKIIKTFEGRETPLEGVPFRIVGTTTVGTEVIIEAETDRNGEILLEGLLVGNYQIEELESELTEGYVLSEKQAAVVAPDEIAELTINNEIQRGDLRIVKTFEDRETPIEGVPFRITGTSLLGIEYDEVFETDALGEIFIGGLPIGEYQITELASELTEGYLLSEAQTVEVEYMTTAEAEIENRLIRGHVRLTKTGDSSEPLAGAVFELYSPAGEMIGEYTTDESGEIFVENLPYGKGYRWLETKAPDGHSGKGSEYHFDITENGATVELTAVNVKIPQTGDSGIAMYVMLLAASSAAAAIALTLGKRREN